jgi:hypothetical protein
MNHLESSHGISSCMLPLLPLLPFKITPSQCAPRLTCLSFYPHPLKWAPLLQPRHHPFQHDFKCVYNTEHLGINLVACMESRRNMASGSEAWHTYVPVRQGWNAVDHFLDLFQLATLWSVRVFILCPSFYTLVYGFHSSLVLGSLFMIICHVPSFSFSESVMEKGKNVVIDPLEIAKHGSLVKKCLMLEPKRKWRQRTACIA